MASVCLGEKIAGWILTTFGRKMENEPTKNLLNLGIDLWIKGWLQEFYECDVYSMKRLNASSWLAVFFKFLVEVAADYYPCSGPCICLSVRRITQKGGWGVSQKKGFWYRVR